MAAMTAKPARVLLGVRGLTRESGERVAGHLRTLPGVVQAILTGARCHHVRMAPDTLMAR